MISTTSSHSEQSDNSDVETDAVADDRVLLAALRALRDGDFSVRLDSNAMGIKGEIARVFNDIVMANKGVSNELPLLLREVRSCIAAVADGDLSAAGRFKVDGRELHREESALVETTHRMIERLHGVSTEVMRIAEGVGVKNTDRKSAVGGEVPDVWARAVDHVQLMADTLADRVQRYTELSLTSRHKSEFLANVSHELRTPLHSILVLGEQLAENEEGNLNARQVEFADTIHAAGTDLLNLISDILDLSKIESGTVAVECDVLSFESLRDTVERTFRHEAETRKPAFFIELSDQLDDVIHTDPKRLLQVLKNLLTNAFKFTDQGSVRLLIDFAHGGWSPGNARLNNAERVLAFSVIDSGSGIPLKQQSLIFEAFQQVNSDSVRRSGGTGLGLAISRELANLLGGEICLQSAPGEGSTFTLYLPQSNSTSKVDRRTLSRKPLRNDRASISRTMLSSFKKTSHKHYEMDTALEGKTVLVVDDDVCNTFALSSILERQKMRVLIASNGREGLDLIDRNQNVSLILMDIMMPEMDGYTAMRKIRAQPKYKQLPIIALTAKAMMGDREKCLKAGASDYITKPVNNQKLVALLRTWLQC